MVCISTNTGSKINQIQAMVPYYVTVWYDDKSIENIFSLTNLVKKNRVIYDSRQHDDLNAHTNRGIVKFRINKQGLYVFNTPYNTANSNVFTTAEENMVEFISRQIERYKLSSKIYINVGLPTVNNLKHMVSTNLI